MNPANAWLLLTARSPGVDISPSGFGSLKPSDVGLALQGLDRTRFLFGMAALAGDRNNLHELVTRFKLEVILPLAEESGWKIKSGSEAYRRLAALAVFEFLQGVRCFVCNGKGTYKPPPEPIRMEGDRERLAEERRQRTQALRRVNRLQWRAFTVSAEIRDRARAGEPNDPRRLKRLKRILRWVSELAQLTELMPEPAPCVTCRATGELLFTDWHRAWLTGFSPDHWYRTWATRYEPMLHILKGWESDCLTHVRERFHPQAA